MREVFKSGNARLYMYLVAMVAIAAVWRAGEAIHLRLAQLPVKEAPRVDRDSTPFDAKSFYPVWVKQAAAMPSIIDGDGEVDALFKKKEEPKLELELPKPPEPDYGELFKQLASVDGVADNGVFINGRFYKVGEKMEEFTFTTGSGKPVVVMVESIKDGRVVFRVGKSKVSFIFGAKG